MSRDVRAGARLGAMLVVLLCVRGVVAQETILTGASTADHLWVVLARTVTENDGTERIVHHLVHVAARQSDLGFGRQRRLTAPPDLVAAWDDRVWLAYRSSEPRRETRWEIFTLEAAYRPELDDYLLLPHDRLGVVAPLTTPGELAALVGSPEGPVGLLLPGSGGVQPVAQLQRLEAGEWTDLPLPPGFFPKMRAWMAPPTPAGRQLAVAYGSAASPGDLVLYREDGETWDRAEFPSGGELVSLGRVGARLLSVTRDGSTVDLAYVRGDRRLPLARLPRPDTPWTILGLADGPRLLTLTEVEARPGRPEQALSMQWIDPISGAPSEPRELRPPPNPVGQVWPMSVLLAVSITAALLFVVFRGTGQAEIRMPEGMATASPITRLVALAIDLVPGAVITLLVLAPAPADLVRSPVFSLKFEDAAAFVMMVTITAVLSAGQELIWGRTLGKRLTGLELLSQDGGPVSRGRLLARNAGKYAVILLPPLALLTLLNPHLQGVHDLVARTVVVGPSGDPSDPGLKDSDEDR